MELTEFAKFTELSLFQIRTGELNTAAAVPSLAILAAVHLKTKPNHRIIVKIQCLGASFQVPRFLNVRSMLDNKCGISRTHKHFCRGGQLVIIYNRLAADRVG
jgi:hypothetical protein